MNLVQSFRANWFGAYGAFIAKLGREGRQEDKDEYSGIILRATIADDDDEERGYLSFSWGNDEKSEAYERCFEQQFPDGECTPREAYTFFKSIQEEFLKYEPKAFLDEFKELLNSVTFEEWKSYILEKKPNLFDGEPLD